MDMPSTHSTATPSVVFDDRERRLFIWTKTRIFSICSDPIVSWRCITHPARTFPWLPGTALSLMGDNLPFFWGDGRSKAIADVPDPRTVELKRFLDVLGERTWRPLVKFEQVRLATWCVMATALQKIPRASIREGVDPLLFWRICKMALRVRDRDRLDFLQRAFDLRKRACWNQFGYRNGVKAIGRRLAPAALGPGVNRFFLQMQANPAARRVLSHLPGQIGPSLATLLAAGGFDYVTHAFLEEVSQLDEVEIFPPLPYLLAIYHLRTIVGLRFVPIKRVASLRAFENLCEEYGFPTKRLPVEASTLETALSTPFPGVETWQDSPNLKVIRDHRSLLRIGWLMKFCVRNESNEDESSIRTGRTVLLYQSRTLLFDAAALVVARSRIDLRRFEITWMGGYDNKTVGDEHKSWLEQEFEELERRRFEKLGRE